MSGPWVAVLTAFITVLPAAIVLAQRRDRTVRYLLAVTTLKPAAIASAQATAAAVDSLHANVRAMAWRMGMRVLEVRVHTTDDMRARTFRVTAEARAVPETWRPVRVAWRRLTRSRP